ncbi:RHS repeat-associated core domain-containing protein [Aliishimia ponticola]|uniref:RHS repeat-associated core domain-containing protein n=1 Tax=Aliishimia ponticola TaxID=2499833 RepID=A0A4S4NF74_9RHOB|nr:RHS repeat-associated core domain-containing protein [Aliishimia ponticola]
MPRLNKRSGVGWRGACQRHALVGGWAWYDAGKLNLRFPGQWFHAEPGLHQNWMRDYDPTLGRYIQADPLGLVDGASVYGYALQNPGRYVDPTGEFVPLLILAAGAAAGLYIDHELEECGCNSFGAVERWTGLGAAWAEFGPSKPKGWVQPDGRSRRIKGSSGFTSRNSENVGKTHPGRSGKAYRTGARQAGRSIARKIPYLGAGFLLFDGYRLARCRGYF